MLDDFAKYAHFVYTLQNSFDCIKSSKISCYKTGRSLALVKGTIFFSTDVQLIFKEQIDVLNGEICHYYYEVIQKVEKLYWYDPQPHSGDPSLTDTFLHHKHIPPDIKHHRVPAPGLSFDKPNLPSIIREIENTLL